MKTIIVKRKSWYQQLSVLDLETGFKFFYLVLALAISALLVFYVFSINELTRGVYTIKNYNKQVSVLLKENKALANRFSSNNFLIKAQERAQELSFQKTEDISYVQVLETSIAKR